MLRRPPEGSAIIAWGLAMAWGLTLLLVSPRIKPLVYILDPLGMRWIFSALSIALILALLWPAFRAVRRGDVVWRTGQQYWLMGLTAVGVSGLVILRREPEQALHAFGYGVLALLIFRAIVFRRRDVSAYVVAAALALVVAFGDEVAQWVSPRRFFRFRDLGIDAAGAVLAMTTLAAGLRPPFISTALSARSRASVCRSVAMVGALLFVCVSSTPARIAAWIPTIGAPRETMIEYGYRFAEPGLGEFRSRLTRDEFAAAERGRGEVLGLVLEAAGRDPVAYEAFLREYTPASDPVLHEARLHLYRRDRFADQARLHAGDEERQRSDAWSAWREHQFLASRLPATMQRPLLALPGHVAEATARLKAPEAAYVSPVDHHLFTAASETFVRLAVGLPTLVMGLLAGLFRWRGVGG